MPTAEHVPTVRTRRARWVGGGLLAAVLLAAGLWLAAGVTGDEDAGGKPVPDQQLRTFDGEPIALDGYEGRPLVVNFFASWCPPCVAEMRDAFQPLHTDVGEEVAFLGVATQDERDAALQVVEITGVTYDLAWDPDGALFRAFGATSMPATFYVDADGHVVGSHMGALTADQLRAQVDAHVDA